MYSKQEAAQLREAFWTTFGKYMSPVLSAEGERINWINYKTGEKNIQFKMQADNRLGSIGIEISHKDAGLQELYYKQLEQFRSLLEAETGEQWIWQPSIFNEHGKLLSIVSTTLPQVNIFKKEDWPALISFFKSRIIALDAFWSQAKYAFEMLGD